MFVQATAYAFRFRRQPSRPNAPRPVPEIGGEIAHAAMRRGVLRRILPSCWSYRIEIERTTPRGHMIDRINY